MADQTKAIELDPKHSDAYLRRAGLRIDKGDEEGAIEDYDKAIEIEPKRSFAYFSRGNARLHKRDWDQAITDFTKAIELEPEDSRSYNSRTYNNRGKARLEKQIQAHGHDQDEVVKAMADFDTAIELDPKYVRTYANRSELRRLQGDTKGSIADLTKVIEFGGDGAYGYYERGSMRHDDGDVEGAIDDLTKAIAINPENGQIYHRRALAFISAGRWQEARADLDSASSRGSKDLYPALYRWVVETRLGQDAQPRLREALDHFQAEKEAGLGANSIDWPVKIAGFLLGQIDEPALRHAAESAGDAETIRGRQCEVCYFAGCVNLAAGRKAEAEARFKECLATDKKNFYEYQLARDELRHLE